MKIIDFRRALDQVLFELSDFGHDTNQMQICIKDGTDEYFYNLRDIDTVDYDTKEKKIVISVI